MKDIVAVEDVRSGKSFLMHLNCALGVCQHLWHPSKMHHVRSRRTVVTARMQRVEGRQAQFGLHVRSSVRTSAAHPARVPL